MQKHKEAIEQIQKTFDNNWNTYQIMLKNNYMYHQEVFSLLHQFFNSHYKSKPLSILDLGCGDASYLVPTLTDIAVEKYTGIDISAVALQQAEQNLSRISGDKQFIQADFSSKIKELSETYDLIFTSYALHHLSLQQKTIFFTDCHKHLKQQGSLIIVDLIMEESEMRDEWLARAEKRHAQQAALTSEQRQVIMTHTRENDFPEKISTYQKISNDTGWQTPQIIFLKDIFCFMVFNKK